LVKIRKHEHNISNSQEELLFRLGMAAAVCHYLRVQGFMDPSVSNDVTLWIAFLSWIEKRMTEEDFFERRKAWIEARAAFLEEMNVLNATFRFGASVFRSGHTCALIWEKLFGSTFPQRISQEWKKYSCAV
jgi:hypothetical protein